MSSRPATVLLRGGTLLVHDDKYQITPLVADLLIEDGIITKIEKDIVTPANAQVLHCESKIVSPGFISTHHHLHQTQMKGRHPNDTFLEYLPKGNFTGALYSVSDLFWGQLSGALEALDAGTTTVVDHSIVNLTPEHRKSSIEALVTSGVRAIYCVAAPRIVKSWKPFVFEDDLASPWAMDNFQSLAAAAPYANRVHIGLGLDNAWLPKEQLEGLFATARKAGTKVITLHVGRSTAFGGIHAPSTAQILDGYGLLASDILLSHNNLPPDDEAERLRRTGAAISCTPNTELQMGLHPIALDRDVYDYSSIGVDCHCQGSGFLPGQMRILLQHARYARSAELSRDGKWSRHTGIGVHEVFNLATVNGARALGMADEIGRIKVGFKADLVIFDSTTPSMLAAAEEDPVAAIVLHSGERDVGTVIVDGIVRKDGGKLPDLEVSDGVKGLGIDGLAGERLGWSDVVRQVLQSRVEWKERTDGLDFVAAEDEIINAFHMDKNSLID